MKRFYVILLFALIAGFAVLVNWSCVQPSPAGVNFQAPVQTLAAMNPTWTFTPTFTHTATPTPTNSPTNTPTFTPTSTATNTPTPTPT